MVALTTDNCVQLTCILKLIYIAVGFHPIKFKSIYQEFPDQLCHGINFTKTSSAYRYIISRHILNKKEKKIILEEKKSIIENGVFE